MNSEDSTDENEEIKEEQEEPIQIVFIGPAFSGKTALINRYISSFSSF